MAHPDDCTNPYASPLEAEQLAGLPPAIFVLAEHDALTLEAQAYAARLREAGVEVTERLYEGAIHAFVNFPTLPPQGIEAIEEMGRLIRAHLVPSDGEV